MANGFTQAAKVVKDDLGGRAVLVLAHGAEVPAKDRREISMWLKTRNDHRPLWVQCSKRMSETVERGGDKGEREVIQDSSDGMFYEWKGRVPVRPQPFRLN